MMFRRLSSQIYSGKSITAISDASAHVEPCRISKELKECENYPDMTFAEKKAFRQAWVKTNYQAACKQRSRTKTYELKNLGGARGEFVGYRKLLEHLGEEEAAKYARACKAKPGWAKWLPMGETWLYNWVAQYSDVQSSKGYKLQEEQQLEEPPAVPLALPAPPPGPPALEDGSPAAAGPQQQHDASSAGNIGGANDTHDDDLDGSESSEPLAKQHRSKGSVRKKGRCSANDTHEDDLDGSESSEPPAKQHRSKGAVRKKGRCSSSESTSSKPKRKRRKKVAKKASTCSSSSSESSELARKRRRRARKKRRSQPSKRLSSSTDEREQTKNRGKGKAALDDGAGRRRKAGQQGKKDPPGTKPRKGGAGKADPNDDPDADCLAAMLLLSCSCSLLAITRADPQLHLVRQELVALKSSAGLEFIL